jgi:hypothetical protein
MPAALGELMKPVRRFTVDVHGNPAITIPRSTVAKTSSTGVVGFVDDVKQAASEPASIGGGGASAASVASEAASESGAGDCKVLPEHASGAIPASERTRTTKVPVRGVMTR